MLRATCAMSPSGFRTATAQLRGPRIITPSRTACPPTFCAIRLSARGALGLFEPLLEALDPAARIDELLLAGVERAARRADLDVELGLRGTRRERVPTAAGHGRDDVLGPNFGLHRRARLAPAASVPTSPRPRRPTTAAAAAASSWTPRPRVRAPALTGGSENGCVGVRPVSLISA